MSVPLPNLSGPIALLPTFFDGDGVDLDAQAAHVGRLRRAGCEAMLVGAAEGEGPTLTPDELDRLVSSARRERVALVGAAICTPCTHAAVERAARAEAAGAAFLALSLPPYNKPTQEGVIAHIREVERASRLPIVVRDEPARTKIGIGDETIARICRLDGVAAIALAPGDIRRFALVDHAGQGRVQVLCGSDFDAVLGQCDERAAWLSCAINIDPGRCLDMQHARLSGDFRTAVRVSRDLCRLLRALDLDDSAVTVKHALSRMRGGEARLRLPLVRLSPASAAIVEAALETLDLSERPRRAQALAMH